MKISIILLALSGCFLPFICSAQTKETIKLKGVKRVDTIVVELNHLSFKQWIDTAKYSYLSPDITTEIFPIPYRGTAEKDTVLLLHFGKPISSEAVLAVIKKNNLYSARIQHLQAISLEFPDLPKQYPIVALGSVTNNVVPILDYNSEAEAKTNKPSPKSSETESKPKHGGCDLFLVALEGQWKPETRFACTLHPTPKGFETVEVKVKKSSK